MKKWFFLLLLLPFLLPVPAMAGLVDFQINVNLSNEPPVCTTTVVTDCVLATRLYYDKGTNQVNVATTLFAATATGAIAQNLPGVAVKSYAKGLVFKAVVQGKDINGALIESNPTSAAPVDLKPGTVISLIVTVP